MCHEFKQQLLNSNKLLMDLLKRRDLSNVEVIIFQLLTENI